MSHLYRTNTGTNNDTSHAYTGFSVRSRPTSAGATRSRSGSFGHNRTSTGNTLSSQNIPSALNGQNQQQTQQAQQQQYGYTQGVSAGYMRPKSAGAVRRSNSDAQQQPQIPPTVHLSNIYGSSNVPTQFQMYAPQQHAQRNNTNNQVPVPTPVVVGIAPRANNQYYTNNNNSNNNSSGQSQNPYMQPQQQIQAIHTPTSAPLVRPLSANATSHTSSNVKNSGVGYQLPADHWSVNYKTHYGYSAATAAVASSAAATTSNNGKYATVATDLNGVPLPSVNNIPQANTVSYGAPGSAGVVIGSATSGGGGMYQKQFIQQQQRPLSASATATKLRSAVDLSYKLDSNGVAIAASGDVTGVIGQTTAGMAAMQINNNINKNTTSAAGTINNSNNNVNSSGAGDTDDVGDDDDDQGIDAAGPVATVTSTLNGMQNNKKILSSQPMVGTATAAANGNNKAVSSGTAANDDDDDEMDGKPVVEQSRSHPEVSMSTPSASMDLGHGSSSSHIAGHHHPHGSAAAAVDARNTSVDSFSDDHIIVGLSTVPNQFCTKRDAVELKKLLVASAGTRGGIVPSSSAVMDMYMVGKVVGVGSYGKVRAAWHRLTSSKVAIKTYDKSKLSDPAHWKRVHSEIKIMEQVSHPRIARMYEAVETPKRMHLIMECLDGGNLCSYVKAKRRLSEDESRRIFFQIMQAIEYLHSLGVSHRDVKLENVLFANDKDIKLIDFGFSTVCQPGKRLKVFCGTPSYMAPEIVRRAEYEGKPVDMWSMGILLYALLCGCFPFRAKAYPDLYRRIARGTFPMPEELSAPVKDLLRQLLNVDAQTRINAHSAIRHSWLQVQLINSPNMDKIRQETAILISDKPADDLDDEVIAELEKFGMSREEIVRLVLTKTHSSLATLYYLLLDTLVTRRKTLQLSQQQQYNSRGGSGVGMFMHHAVHGQQQQQVGINGTSAAMANRLKQNNSNSSSNGVGIVQSNAGVVVGSGVGTMKVKSSGYPDATTAAASAAAAAMAARQEKQEALIQQQQAADHMAAMQQQQMIDRQEYRLRPKSASQNRVGSNTTTGGGTSSGNNINISSNNNNNQRPLSAFAGRR